MLSRADISCANDIPPLITRHSPPSLVPYPLLPMPWDFTLLILLLGLVVPWRSVVRMRQLLRTPSTTSEQRLILYATTMAGQWLIAGVALWRSLARGIPARALGLALDDPATALTSAAALCVIMSAAQVFALRRLSRLPASEQGYAGILARKLMPQNSVESLAFVALASTVAVCEELLYRGFLLAAFVRVFGMTSGGMLLAALASTLLFAVGHIYQGLKGVTSTFVLGLAFCALRIATGSLVPTIAVHFCVDVVAGLAAPRFLAGAAAAPASRVATSAESPE